MSLNFLHVFKGLPPWMLLFAGSILGSVKSVWNFVYDHTIGFLVNKVSVSIVVEDNEHREAYAWLSEWMERALAKRKINSLLLRKSSDRSLEEDDDKRYTLVPHYGSYYLMFKKRPMMVSHYKDETPQQGQRKMHTLWIQIWGTRDRNMVLDLLKQARDEYLAQQPKALHFYRWSEYNHEWDEQDLKLRPLDTIYLPEAQLTEIVGDIRVFLESKPMYENLGIPRRYGVLFEGPPGTGKTTLIIALASHFNIPVYAINLNQPEMCGDHLMSILNQCAEPSFVLFEDIDCVPVTASREADEDSDEAKADNSPKAVNLSELLNALDGLGASEERVVFMTSNHPENLDPALIRSGRVDGRWTINYSADKELKSFYDAVSKHRSLPTWEDFRAALPESTTIADAQALAFKGTHGLAAD